MTLSLLSVSSGPAHPAGAADLNRQLEAIVTQVLPPNFSISIQVADLASGRVLMEKNPDLALVPASTMKIVTSSAAFGCLHPDFTFVTEVLADDVKGRSVGNIYLKGSGDPYLVSEELFALTRKVRDEGLVEVRGDIVVDDSYFVPDKPLDEQERLGTRAYHAPYSALSLNFNTIWIVVNPGSRPGDPAEVLLDPMSEYATLKASVKTVQGSAPAKVSIEKECTSSGRDVISVTGTVGLNAPLRGRYANVSTPSLYTGEVFKEFLLREGVKVCGQVIQGRAPSSAASYTKYPSRPLGIIIYGLNKFSNNFMAEQISLAMGAAVHGEPGTREKGLSVIRKHLLDLGVDERAFRLSEASGLSRNNRISSSALVRVLLASARDFKYNAEFIASFGVAGVDGTLKEKYTDSAAKRRIRAKTGNLRGVNALAGYGLSRKGRTLVFAVIVNSLKEGAGFIDYGDRIIRSVLDLPIGKN